MPRGRFVSACLVLAALAPAPVLADAGFSVGRNFVAADLGDVLVLNHDNFLRTPAPDVNGGVGPDHVVLFIKGAYRVWDKRTGSLVQSINDLDFWNRSFTNNGLTYQTVQTRGPSDPRILFDRMTNRWYAVGIDRTGTDEGVLNIAVSAGPDPSGPSAWRGFTLQAFAPGWPDFPTVGLDRRGLHVSSSVFDAYGSFQFTQYSFLPSANLLAVNPGGNDAVQFQVSGASVTNPAMQTRPRAPGATLPVLATTGNFLRIGKAGDLPTDPISLRTVLPAVAVTTGGTAPQPPGAASVFALDARISSSVVLAGEEVWGVANFNSGIRWFRVDANSGASLEQGTISAPNLKLFFPSIAVDDTGQVVIGMNGSGSTTFIGSYAVAGRTVDGVTTFGDLAQLAAGQATYQLFDNVGRNRWGDYSTTVIDPTDANVFWTFQEVANAPRYVPELDRIVNNNRAVWITQVFVPEAGGVGLFCCGLWVLRRRSRVSTANAFTPP